MKTFLAMLEDVWVAVAFAEAGEYGCLAPHPCQARSNEVVRIQAL